MTSQTPSSESLEKLDFALSDLITIFEKQVITNADCLWHSIKDNCNLSANELENVKLYIDSLVKSPVKRQVGRLRAIRRGLREETSSDK